MLTLLAGGAFFIWEFIGLEDLRRFILAQVILVGAWIMVYALILKKEEEPFLRFGALKWKESQLVNILVIGRIGSGKTVSAINQIIVQISRTYDNWGGMILGVKGTEHLFIEEHFKHIGREDDIRCLEVRPENESESWDPPFRINLTGDRRLPWSAYATMIVDTGKALSGEGGNGFWSDTAQQVISNTFELLDRLDLPTTIPELFTTLTNLEILQDRLKDLAKAQGGSEEVRRIIRHLDKTFLTAEAKEQLEGTMGTINQYLGFFMNPDISKVFCSKDPNVHIQDLDYGKVLATSIPQRFIKERSYIHTLLKSLAYYHGMLRYDDDVKNKRYIEKCNRIFMFMDEAQDTITGSTTGVGDHKILDRIRGAKLSCVYAMQSTHSPDSKIGRDKRANLINHFTTRFYFQLSDEDEAMEVSKLLGQVKYIKKSHSKSRQRNGYSISNSRSEEYTYRVQPIVFTSLDEHQAIVVHPNKNFGMMIVPPLDTNGRIPEWFQKKRSGLKSLGQLRKYVKHR